MNYFDMVLPSLPKILKDILFIPIHMAIGIAVGASAAAGYHAGQSAKDKGETGTETSYEMDGTPVYHADRSSIEAYYSPWREAGEGRYEDEDIGAGLATMGLSQLFGSQSDVRKVDVGGTTVWSDDYNDALAQTGGDSQAAIDLMKKYGITEDGAWGLGAGNQGTELYQAAKIRDEERQFQMDMQERLFAMSAEYGRQQILQAEESTRRTIERNIERFPRISGIALEESTKAGNVLNQFMQKEFEGALDSLYPEWREQIVREGAKAQQGAIDLTDRFATQILPEAIKSADMIGLQMLEQTSSMLAGEVPDDVAYQLKKHAAEVSQQIGVRGQAAQYLTARDLGRTSLDMIQMGMQNAPGAANFLPAAYNTFTQTLQNPVTTGMQVTNAMAPYRAPQADQAAIYGSQLGILSGIGNVNPTSAYGTNAQIGSNAGSLVQNQLQYGNNQANDAYWNQLNYGSQMKALGAAGSSGGGILSGAIGGAAAGSSFGPWGAAIGAIGGGIMGAQK